MRTTVKRQTWVLLLAALCFSCATTTTTSTTWTASAPGGPPRFGYVESVQEIVQRVEGNPAGGALAAP
jgi:carbonic anhydrase